MVKNYYPELFHNSALHNEFKNVQKYMYEFSEFLVKVMHVSDVGARLEGTATFLDNCTALRECGIHESPRLLLSKVKGLRMVEMEDGGMCCGFGNTFAGKFEEIASGLAQKKVTHAVAAGAEIIVSTDMGCLMHLEGYIRKEKLPVRVMHIADVLAG
jgi:L-lactate dehydrogenase complex protein LldE